MFSRLYLVWVTGLRTMVCADTQCALFVFIAQTEQMHSICVVLSREIKKIKSRNAKRHFCFLWSEWLDLNQRPQPGPPKARALASGNPRHPFRTFGAGRGLGCWFKANRTNEITPMSKYSSALFGTSVHNEITQILYFTAFKTYSDRTLPIKYR